MQTNIETLFGLLAVCVALGILSHWMRLPYPILLVIGGLLLSFQESLPRYKLAPEIVFFVFLPPILYAAAFNTEWSRFRLHLRAISMLAVGLVLFTTVGVACVAHYFVGVPWTVGFVLGAVISPPDAVAAIAITSRVKVPKTVTTILEGESLVNDASALVTYRIAIAAVLGGAFSFADAFGQFVLVSTGGIGLGVAFAFVMMLLHRWLRKYQLADAKLTILITLLTPYIIYFTAEHLHVSGVLGVVVAGLMIGNRANKVFPEELFQEARAVWEMIDFLLNSVIFILIGLQLPAIVDQLSDQYSPWQLTLYCAAISAVVILTRIVWVFPGAYLPRWLDRKIYGHGDPYPPWQNVLVVAWTGMRGVVSLAAAFGIPVHLANGDPFPDRALIQFLTFWVIFTTLVGQGLTLPLIIRWLGVCVFHPSPSTNADEPAPPHAEC